MQLHHSWWQRCCQSFVAERNETQTARPHRTPTCMTTRSGRAYKAGQVTAMSDTENRGAMTSRKGMETLMRMLLEDRKAREDDLTREQERREAAEARHASQMAEQLEMMKSMLDHLLARPHEVEMTSLSSRPYTSDKIGLRKFTDSDDIEAFLTTFERLMALYYMEESHWVAKLAPQLTGRAQQAYAAMPAGEALVYQDVKKAVLRRYDINMETFHQRFRAARRKDGEGYMELATRLGDLFWKWTADCSTVDAVAEKVMTE